MRATFYCLLVFLLFAPSLIYAQRPSALTRIAFGSCSKQDSAQIWKAVVSQRPQLWIWLGDNIYADTHDPKVMRSYYDKQKNNPDYLSLLKTCPVIGIWDDHDYGQNDGGKYYSRKNESKEELLRFLDVPANDPVRNHEGVYSSHTYGNGRQKIKIILLDTRAFRDTLIKSTIKGRKYEVNPDGDILGEEQWKWLEKELTNSDAAIHLIGSGVQFISNEHTNEKWGNFPKSRQRMLSLLAKLKPSHPIILSGDRHMAEFSRLNVDGLPYPLFDFTSSGLTHTWAYKTLTEPNEHRVGKMIIAKNFGMLLIDWSDKEPTVTMEIHGPTGEILETTFAR